MVGRLLFFWNGKFSGAMLISGNIPCVLSALSHVLNLKEAPCHHPEVPDRCRPALRPWSNELKASRCVYGWIDGRMDNQLSGRMDET